MYWKEMQVIFRKYYGFLLVAIIMVMFFSKFNSVITDAKGESLKILVIKEDKIVTEILSNYASNIEFTYVSNQNEGINIMKNKSDIDAFVYYQEKNNALQVIINPISSKSKDIQFIFQNIKYSTDYKLTILNKESNAQEENERLRNIFNSFSFILTLVCFFIPYKMLADEKNTLTAIVLSPVKNSTILLAKIMSVCLLYSVGCFYFMISFDLSIKIIVILFLIGAILSLFGLLAGIFSNNKYITYLFYPLTGIIIMLPFVINKMIDYKNLIWTLNNSISAFLLIVLLEILIFVIFYIALNFVFKVKIRRDRVC